MSKIRFEAAKELIAQRKYAEARVILKTIDHPTAREWEAKIARLDLSFMPVKPLADTRPRPNNPKWKRYAVITGGIVFVIVFLNMVGYVSVLPPPPKVAIGQQATRTRPNAYVMPTKDATRAINQAKTSDAMYTAFYITQTYQVTQAYEATRDQGATRTAITTNLTLSPIYKSPTPSFQITPMPPSVYYSLGSIEVMACPFYDCEYVREYGRGESVIVIGKVRNNENRPNKFWFVIQPPDGTANMYGYNDFFVVNPPPPK